MSPEKLYKLVKLIKIKEKKKKGRDDGLIALTPTYFQRQETWLLCKHVQFVMVG